MVKNKIAYPTLVSRYKQFETRSNTGRLGYLSFDKPGEINSSLNVMSYIIDRLKTMSAGPLPAFKFGFSTQTTKKAILLCSSTEKNSFIPVTKSGFRLLIVSAIHDIWYTEFMNTGMSLKVLVNEMVANVKIVNTIKDDTAKNDKKTFFASDSIIEFDKLMDSFHNTYISSAGVEFTEEFERQLNAVYVSLLSLLGNSIQDKNSKETRMDFRTNDPVAIALVILWDYVCVCDSFFDIATRASNDVCKKTTLPFILDTKSQDTITTLYRNYVFENAAKNFRDNINTVKVSELIGFNPASFGLGFNKRARLVMTEMYASQITNLFTSILNTVALESKFKACADMLFLANFVDASRKNKVVPKELRLLAPIFWNIKDGKVHTSIKDYDLASQLSAIPQEVMNYVKDLAKFVESICFVDPQVDDLYYITTVVTEKGPVDSIIRINLIKRLSDPSYLLRSVRLSDVILQTDYKQINMINVPFGLNDKMSHIKIPNDLDKFNKTADLEDLKAKANIDETIEMSNSCVFVGQIDELRDFVSSKSKFYEIEQLDSVAGEFLLQIRSACYAIKPNKRYSGQIIGDYAFDSDCFELATINPSKASFVELLLSVPHQALNLHKDELIELYESRISKLQTYNNTNPCIFTARFASYESTKIAASPLNLYLTVKGIDNKTNVNSLVVTAVSSFIDKDPDSDSIKKVLKNKDALLPVRSVLTSDLEFDLQLPLSVLSDDAKYRLSSDPSSEIKGPLSAKDGNPIWTISLLSAKDGVKEFFDGLTKDELFRLKISINEYNTDYGIRSIWRRDDKMLINYQFDDPDLTDFVRRGSSVCFDSNGLKKGTAIFSRYYSNVFKSLSLSSNPILSTVGSFRISLSLGILKIVLLYIAYRLYDTWSSFDNYDLNKEEFSVFKKSIERLSSYMSVIYHQNTPMSVFGCPTVVKVSEFVDILNNLSDTLQKAEDFKAIKGDAAIKTKVIESIRSVISKLEGDDINDLIRYQLIPVPKPFIADLQLIGDLVTQKPIKILNAPTLADSVSLPGLDMYIGGDLTKQIADCCIDYINSSAKDQVL